MRIEKYKKLSNGRYKISFDNNQDIILYEEVILYYELLLKKEIDNDLLIEIDKMNQEWDVYYVGLNSLRTRFKSVYELKMFLLKKEYPNDLVDKAVDKLLKQGYLNDRSYTKGFIHNRIITSSYGPFRIEKELLDKKIDSNIIKEEMEVFTKEEQDEKIRKIIDKGIKTNHNRGGVVLKNKIYNDLKNLGYDISSINSIISTYSFQNNEEIARKEYDKLYRKYSRKYSGDELKRKIREKMYLKGFDISNLE